MTQAAQRGHDGGVFTLAHLSDPHLPLPEPVRWRDLASKRVTGYLNWLRSRRYAHDPSVLRRVIGDLKTTATDHIAIAGDLVNIALPAEFEQARKWLIGIGPQYDITVVPGNHDIYVKGALDLMEAACASSMRGDDDKPGFPFVRKREAIALVALNTGVPTGPFFATGKLGKEQLTRLATMLGALRRENLFRVVLMHHPPVSENSWLKRLTDANGFLRVIAAQGAELVLHGHDHIQQLHWLPGPSGRVPSVGVPSASGAPGHARNPGGYNLYRIEGESGAWRCEMEERAIGTDGRIATRKRTMLTA